LTKKLFIAYRQLFSKEQSQFISIVTFISTLAIALGVSSLIVVLSVMNGFEAEIEKRVITLSSHITIQSDQPIRQWQSIVDELEQFSDIKHAIPFVEAKGIISNKVEESTGIIITGINPVDKLFFDIQLEDLANGELILGRGLALQLSLKAGDRALLTVPRISPQGKISFPDSQYFRVKKVVEFGLQRYDSTQVVMHQDDASLLLGLGRAVNGVSVELDNVYQVKSMIKEIESTLKKIIGLEITVTDWSKENQALFDAIVIEKTIMSVLLFMIVLIATFNVIVMLSMSVDDKKRDIAILKSIGFTSKDLTHIFFIQGLLSVLFGVLFGVFFGITILMNLDSLEWIIRHLFGFEFLPEGLYYITSMPYILRYTDVVLICIGALTVSVFACLYPSIKASRENPTEILRMYKG
jgi:lipoprotein-releasing system permease protein